MTKFFTAAFAFVAVTIGIASASSSVSFTNDAAAGPANGFVSIPLNKFDTGLGTLTDVVVTVNFVTVGGSFSVTSTGSPSSVTAIGSIPILQATTNAPLGYTDFNTGFSSFPVSSSPSAPFSVPASSSQLFTIGSTNVLENNIQSIAPTFWSSYQSIGGVGSIVFEIANFPSVTVAGSGFTLDASAFTATANMTVTYNYTPTAPIPEPGTWAVGALLLGGAAYSVWRRRQNTAVEPAAAA
jgi:hypothetical protein